MASYAPLLAKEGYNQWNPNLIWFNNEAVCPTPDYYVQKMYSENNGSYTVENTVKVQGEERVYNVGVGTWSTSAEFKDITVTDNATGEAISLELNKVVSGAWTEADGIYSQTSTSVNGAFNIAPVESESYTLSLKAMKTGGNEGFLIPVQYSDGDNYIFWNIAGWTNTSHAVQRVVNGVKSTITSNITGSIQSNVWYDVSVTIENDWMYCYLNGELVHKVCIALTKGPVYSTTSVDEKSGDIIIKLVNVSEQKAQVDINLANADFIAPVCDEIVLTGNGKSTKNTFASPTNAAEVKGVFDGASDSFVYEMEGLSFVVLRLHTTESYVTGTEEISLNNPHKLPDTVKVTLGDGTTEDRRVEWRLASSGAYYYGGSYVVEGTLADSNAIATAILNIPTHGMVEFKDNNTALVYTREKTQVKIAVYNADGSLANVTTREIDGEEEIRFTMPEGGKVKIMLWGDNMTPLEKASEK